MNKTQAIILLAAITPLAIGFLVMGVVEAWRLRKRRKGEGPDAL